MRHAAIQTVSQNAGSGFARVVALAGALSVLCPSIEASATPNLVTNGSFETTTALYTSTQGGQITNSNLSGWSQSTCTYACGSGPNSLFMFLAAPNYVTNGVDFMGTTINFWSGPGTSPDGGNAITQDAGNELGSLQQSISGLKVGDHYQLTFYQATMQAVDAQANASFTADWQVSLGSSTQSSPSAFNAYKAYTPWQLVTLNFTANAATEMLSFLAYSPNNGEPPFMLLDGVSLIDINEPVSLGVMVLGLAALLTARSRRARVAAEPK
jgi:hypothetical protein